MKSYKIKKGDKFLCLEDYIMDDERIGYTKGLIYSSYVNNCITCNTGDINHQMDNQEDFFYFFMPQQDVGKELKFISNIDYWKQRCLLAEVCLDKSPCDPDITSDQIKAHDAHNEFLKTYGYYETTI